MKINRNLRAVFAIIFVTAIFFATVAACSSNGGELIGISMPTRSSERWIKEGYYLKDLLEERGLKVDLQFAEDDIPTQRDQIRTMIYNGARVLVVAAIDASVLSDTLEAAAKDGVHIIAYDRLLVDTESVSYYTSFDNVMVGQLQAESLLEGLKAHNSPSPWNIELFAGSPDDRNAYYVLQGSMNVLQPYVDSGEIIIRSGQETQDEIGTLRWDGDTAQRRMSDILSTYYNEDTQIHGILSPFDNLSRGIVAALISFGYEVGTDEWPIITGQDAESASVAMIRDGAQYSTVFKDVRILARAASEMIDDLLNGREPEINDVTSYHNNVFIVPSFIITPHIVTAENYIELIIDTGYLTLADLD